MFNFPGETSFELVNDTVTIKDGSGQSSDQVLQFFIYEGWIN
jgi:hypothetical protein